MAESKGMFISKKMMAYLGGFFIFVVFVAVLLSGTTTDGVPELSLNVRAEFLIFVVTLLGVAVFHNNTFTVALIGMLSVSAMKLAFDDQFHLVEHMQHEARTLIGLLGLLLGFQILSKYFEESNIPEILPRFLPDSAMGGFVLLACVFVLSGFLDNIAAAMIGGTVALVVYRGKVDIGYIAAIVASSNAGGAGSVIGDTTTTMMWIAGVSPWDVIHAYIGAFVAFMFFAPICARKQQKYQAIQKDEIGHHQVKWRPLMAVAVILVGAIAANILLDFPAAGVWAGIILSTVLLHRAPWGELNQATIKGSLFLIMLVTTASMMPVSELPAASASTTFVMGLISSVFDNIPLTKLALDQGGYDWGMLALAVGFGGSMIWFGSSAGVSITNKFPHGKDVAAWIRHGWAIPVGYVLGFVVQYLIMGWHPAAI